MLLVNCSGGEDTGTAASGSNSGGGSCSTNDNTGTAVGSRSWSAPQSIGLNTGEAGEPHISANSDGYVFALWPEWTGTNYGVWANRYVPGVGWETAQRIDANDGNASGTVVAIDASGNAIAVWAQVDPLNAARNNIWANRYDVGTGWGTPELIETRNDGTTSSPRVVIDGNGNAIAVWNQHQTNAITIILSNRYTAGRGWGNAEMVSVDDGVHTAGRPDIGIDADGNAVVLWSDVIENAFGGTDRRLWLNRYTAGTGWGTPEFVDSAAGWLAVQANGDLVLVLKKSTGLWAKRYLAGSGWAAEQLLEADISQMWDEHIATNANGDVYFVWVDRTTSWDLRAKRHTAAGGWETTRSIESYCDRSMLPSIAVDPAGNAVALWVVVDPALARPPFNGFSIRTNHHLVGAGWSTDSWFENYAGGDTSAPTVAADGSANVIALWMQTVGGVRQIWASRLE